MKPLSKRSSGWSHEPGHSRDELEWSNRLAQALVQGGYDTNANLDPLVAEAEATGQTLAELLISRNLALPGVVVGALAHLAQMQAIDLAAMTPSADAVAALPQDMAREFGAVALQFEGSMLAVAFAEPPTPPTSMLCPRVSDTASIRFWPIPS